MSNSSLVCHVNISPNKTSPRDHVIDTVTIHCVCGQVSAESLGNWFSKPSTEASSNYGVDMNGRVGMYVEEKDRSWCTSNRSNDHRAITIEVASDTKPPYAVTDAAYEGLIKLLVDICKRNPGIKKLRWKNDKGLIGEVAVQNMTVHRWFKNKACPGDYLFSRHADIVNRVNSLLQVDTSSAPSAVANADEIIWKFFKSKGLNDFAVAGIMGNLDAESGLRPNNLQNSYEKSLNHTDDSYTKAVDDGTYTDFIVDKAGYGIAQWTYHSRKKALIEYAKKVKKSIGDLGMQLDFMWDELQGYKSVMKTLNGATSVLEASNAVLLDYERPADQSTAVQNRRARYGQSFYDKFVKYDDSPTDEIVVMYRVRKTWKDSKGQIGAFTILANAKNLVDKNPGYFVFDEHGNAVYPKVVDKAPSSKKAVPAQSKNSALAGRYQVTASSGLNLRYKPAVLDDSAVITAIPTGAVVENYGYYTTVNGVKWLLVAYKGKVGYVHSGYVKKPN